jgi:hypothetical protein
VDEEEGFVGFGRGRGGRPAGRDANEVTSVVVFDLAEAVESGFVGEDALDREDEGVEDEGTLVNSDGVEGEANDLDLGVAAFLEGRGGSSFDELDAVLCESEEMSAMAAGL